ncbi:unnamed protein product [Coccothraustes coccothraustes]
MPIARGCHVTTQHWAPGVVGGASFAYAAVWKPRPPCWPLGRGEAWREGSPLAALLGAGLTHLGALAGLGQDTRPGPGPEGTQGRAGAQGPSGDAIREQERGIATPMALEGSEV